MSPSPSSLSPPVGRDTATTRHRLPRMPFLTTAALMLAFPGFGLPLPLMPDALLSPSSPDVLLSRRQLFVPAIGQGPIPGPPGLLGGLGPGNLGVLGGPAGGLPPGFIGGPGVAPAGGLLGGGFTGSQGLGLPAGTGFGGGFGVPGGGFGVPAGFPGAGIVGGGPGVGGGFGGVGLGGTAPGEPIFSPFGALVSGTPRAAGNGANRLTRRTVTDTAEQTSRDALRNIVAAGGDPGAAPGADVGSTPRTNTYAKSDGVPVPQAGMSGLTPTRAGSVASDPTTQQAIVSVLQSMIPLLQQNMAQAASLDATLKSTNGAAAEGGAQRPAAATTQSATSSSSALQARTNILGALMDDVSSPILRPLARVAAGLASLLGDSSNDVFSSGRSAADSGGGARNVASIPDGYLPGSLRDQATPAFATAGSNTVAAAPTRPAPQQTQASTTPASSPDGDSAGSLASLAGQNTSAAGPSTHSGSNAPQSSPALAQPPAQAAGTTQNNSNNNNNSRVDGGIALVPVRAGNVTGVALFPVGAPGSADSVSTTSAAPAESQPASGAANPQNKAAAVGGNVNFSGVTGARAVSKLPTST
ncbi:hypothetical protein PYCC9005_004462 [Savitreella phatthalungensis]